MALSTCANVTTSAMLGSSSVEKPALMVCQSPGWGCVVSRRVRDQSASLLVRVFSEGKGDFDQVEARSMPKTGL